MAERLSMYSQVVRQQMLATAMCPNCQEMNLKGRKPMLELTDEGIFCNKCGETFPANRPKAEPLE